MFFFACLDSYKYFYLLFDFINILLYYIKIILLINLIIYMKVLKVNCENFTEEQMMSLDELLMSTDFIDINYNIDTDVKQLYFYKKNYTGEILWFKDYIEWWKLTKQFLLENNLIQSKEDNSLYSLVDIDDKAILKNVDVEIKENDLDKYIVK